MDFRNIREDRGDPNLITIRFEKDYEYETYERVVFSFLDLFGNLGGVFEIFSMFGGYIVAIFASRYFNYSIISSLYQIDASCKAGGQGSDNRSYENPSDHLSSDDSKDEDVPDDLREEIKVANERRTAQDKNAMPTPSNSDQHDKIETKKELERKAKQSMSDRRRYHYNCLDF